MNTPCKYCGEIEDKQNKPGLKCEMCSNLVHLPCLRRPGTPGDFVCDVFFKFTCEDCSPKNKEDFIRYKFPWVNVIYLTLHHLSIQSYGISHRGYFHYKTHICSFIDRYWQALFGNSNKQKKNWVGTIAGVLSVYNKVFFKSGSMALGETGWWKLLHSFSPAVAAHIIQELAKDRPRNRPRNQQPMDQTYFQQKICEMGYKDLINEDTDELNSDPVPMKKRRMDSEDSAAGASFYVMDNVDNDSSKQEFLEEVCYEEVRILPSEQIQYSDIENMTDLNNFEIRPLEKETKGEKSNENYQNLNFFQSFYDSDSPSGSEADKKPEKPKKDKPFVQRESLFSTELNSIELPWEERDTEPPKQNLVELTQYEEIQLLKKVEAMIPKVRDPNKRAYLYRFKAKLALRRLKRHKHLPLFDMDRAVKLLGGYITEDQGVMVNTERVLDRFQRSYLMDKLCGTISSPSSGTLLLSTVESSPFRSAYSGATLKPYIRRDHDSKPTWLKITDELLRRTHRHIKGYSPPPRATIDYSYVRPQHIAAINNLCAQFFWPGIDLTESLQYPEFSCVVSYRRLVVGFSFLVPDTAHSQAYISFVLVRPEWRRAGIASFMLYHLLQTCTGKDVTLHVSPTNPAIFLYQKFGFKVEELIQDFYEKYFDIDYKGCRHALFLRLVR